MESALYTECDSEGYFCRQFALESESNKMSTMGDCSNLWKLCKNTRRFSRQLTRCPLV